MILIWGLSTKMASSQTVLESLFGVGPECMAGQFSKSLHNIKPYREFMILIIITVAKTNKCIKQQIILFSKKSQDQ